MQEIVFDKNFQDHVVSALITDDEFLAHCQLLLPVDSFLSPIARKLVECIYQFYLNYGTAPKNDFQSYFNQLVKAGAFTEGDGQICTKYLVDISTIAPNPKYLLVTISNWKRRQAVKGALLESAPLVERGGSADLTKAWQILEQAFNQGVSSVEAGLDLFSVTHLPDNRQFAHFEFMIPELDRVVRGAKRGELVAIHGTPGIGKSWFLIHCLRAISFQGCTGVMYSGEMDEWEIVTRAVQNFGGLSDRKRKETRVWNSSLKCFQVTENPKTVWELGATRESIAAARGFGSRIFIKEFVGQEYQVADMEAHLLFLQRSKGIFPLVVLVDYDEMVAPSRPYEKKRLALLDVFDGLKALAKKLQVVVILCTQSNAAGLSAQVMDMRHLGEAFAKAKPTDLMISLNQNEEEYLEGVMRLFVYKNRNGPKHQQIKIWQNFDIGQFCFHSERLKFVRANHAQVGQQGAGEQ